MLCKAFWMEHRKHICRVIAHKNNFLPNEGQGLTASDVFLISWGLKPKGFFAVSFGTGSVSCKGKRLVVRLSSSVCDSGSRASMRWFSSTYTFQCCAKKKSETNGSFNDNNYMHERIRMTCSRYGWLERGNIRKALSLCSDLCNQSSKYPTMFKVIFLRYGPFMSRKKFYEQWERFALEHHDCARLEHTQYFPQVFESVVEFAYVWACNATLFNFILHLSCDCWISAMCEQGEHSVKSCQTT